MSNDLLIRNVRPMGGETVDLLVTGGRIARMAAGIDAPGVPVEDGGGALAIPGLVEAHTHLDKTLWGMGWRPNQAGPRLLDRIDNERAVKKAWDIDPARQSARQVALSVSKGTTHIRSHVDVDTEVGLWGIEGVMETRDRLRDAAFVEIVAFPQSGLLRRPGTLELMDRALAMGAEVVGGLDPCAIDRDPKGHLDAIFGLAEKHGKPIDIHLHEPGTMGAFSFELILERTRALGMQGKVTVSHAFALGAPDPALVDPLIERLAAERVWIMTTAPAATVAPPVRRLIEAGVHVCSGSDGIRDTWGPYGNADMLERAMFVGMKNGFRHDPDLAMALAVCTTEGAAVMGVADYGLAVGKSADLVLVEGETLAEAVVSRPVRRLVVKGGRIVARDGAALLAVA